MDNRKKITKSDNVTRQITETKRSAEYMEKVISIPSVFKGLDKHLEWMASIPSVSKGLDKHLVHRQTIFAILILLWYHWIPIYLLVQIQLTLMEWSIQCVSKNIK